MQGQVALRSNHCPLPPGSSSATAGGGWSSAHVHILFHQWWDVGSCLELMKMCVWALRCQLCLPDAWDTAR